MWAQQYKQYDRLFFIMEIGITDTISKRDPRPLGRCYTEWIRRRELRHMNMIISGFKYLKWCARFRRFYSEADVEPDVGGMGGARTRRRGYKIPSSGGGGGMYKNPKL